MLLPFLLCVMILYVPPPLGAAAVMPMGTLAGVAVLALLNAAFAWAGCTLASPGGAIPRLLSPRKLRALLSGAVVGFVLADVFVLRWPLAVQTLFAGRRWAVLVDDLFLLMPAIVMAVTVMAFWHRFSVRSGNVQLSLSSYVWLRFRVEMAIILVPWLALVFTTDLSDAVFYRSPHLDLITGFVSVGTLAGILVFSPLLLRTIWNCAPLPDGPLRQRLEEFCRRVGFRCHDILIWNTRNHLGNAGVVGPTPLLRYVMVTDALLRNCTDAEIEAIFAHEVAHVKHHHLPVYMLFALGFLVFYLNLGDALAGLGLIEPMRDLMSLEMTTAQAVAMLAFAGLYWVFVFGWVSRRMELQADLFALRVGESPYAFANALHKLNAMSGGQAGASFWRHFSIPARLAFLSRIVEDPSYAGRFERRITFIKVGLLVLLGLALARLALFRPELVGL